jgi:hypothetical protein
VHENASHKRWGEETKLRAIPPEHGFNAPFLSDSPAGFAQLFWETDREQAHKRCRADDDRVEILEEFRSFAPSSPA